MMIMKTLYFYYALNQKTTSKKTLLKRYTCKSGPSSKLFEHENIIWGEFNM